MFNLLLTTLCTILESFLIIYMICHFLSIPFSRICASYLLGLPIFFITCYAGLLIFHNDSVTFFLGISFLYILIKLIFKKSIIDTLLLFGISYTIITVIELVIITFMGFTATVVNHVGYTLAGNALTTILILLLCHFAPLHKFCNQLFSIHKYMKLAICNGFICLLLLVLYGKIATQHFFNAFALILFTVLLLMLFNIHTLYYTAKLEKQQEQLSAYEQYLPIVDELIDYVRSRQHGFDNRLLTLRSLPINYRDYASLSHALNENTEAILGDNIQYELLKINQKLVSGFLFSKYCECKRAGKNLILSLHTYAFPTTIPEYILIDILGILMDNALEATPSDKVCYFLLEGIPEQSFKITTKNIGPAMTPELRTAFFRKGYTTKTDEKKSHGLGLYTLKEYMKSYNGSIRFTNEELHGERYLVVEVTFAKAEKIKSQTA